MHAGKPLLLTEGTTQSQALNRHLSPIDAPQPATVVFPRAFQALIFDLDGVLADTAHLHHAAWKRLTDEIGLPWNEGIGEKLKGVDRAASLEIVLGEAAGGYTREQKRQLADRKNGYYRKAIETFGP